jgi:2-oxoglutarate ferredoxin oxidoreductase subunit gamma
MFYEEIIVAGSGGQGVLVLGELLGIAAIEGGNNATWLPSYGPEMRGGTANCSVVLSSEPIGSPLIDEPTILICFNQPSLTKFAPTVAKGGLIVVNEDAIATWPEIEGADWVKVRASQLAAGLENEKTINMVMLGALLRKRSFASMDNLTAAMAEIWGAEKAEKLMPLNLRAIETGKGV